jgi:pyruvate/2-oxoglutarate dehydrogenase complex dihydrolipoamide acyltransferase (E2) component
MATPTIHPAQCAILRVGEVQSSVVVMGDTIATRPRPCSMLTFDHRILDRVRVEASPVEVIELVRRPGSQNHRHVGRSSR